MPHLRLHIATLGIINLTVVSSTFSYPYKKKKKVKVYEQFTADSWQFIAGDVMATFQIQSPFLLQMNQNLSLDWTSENLQLGTAAAPSAECLPMPTIGVNPAYDVVE